MAVCPRLSTRYRAVYIAGDHIGHIWSVSQLLYETGVTIKLKKCKFLAETISYLGDVIWPGGLEPAERTTDAAAKSESPTTQTELLSFSRLCNVFMLFVANFARFSALLNE